ncbi:MAG: Zn-ribbon domain-containing OB-fold protein [Candidatus Caldarchaeum sp.]
MSIESFYEYPAGVAVSKFLNGLRQGKLIASRCGECKKSIIPPRAYCTSCLKPVVEYYEVEPVGEIVTYTVSHITMGDSSNVQPITWVFVKFNGVEGGLMHRLNPDIKPSPGLKVRLVFNQQRVGSILDIKYFGAA